VEVAVGVCHEGGGEEGGKRRMRECRMGLGEV
jgi:hypothetical protein